MGSIDKAPNRRVLENHCIDATEVVRKKGANEPVAGDGYLNDPEDERL
jgi:hypothetical protein